MNKKIFNFEVKTNLKFGVGEALNLSNYLKTLDIKSPYMIIDQSVYKSRYGKKVVKESDIQNIMLYSKGEPTYELLEKYRNFVGTSIDCIVGIGGGSTIDFAKGLAFLATNKKQAIEYKGFPTNVNKPLPVVAVSTTAGTGSEVTYNAVFIDTKVKKKLGINTKLNFPKLAILDPNILEDCPKLVMVSSGIDALVHSTEALISKNSDIITKMFAREAIGMLVDSLQKLDKRNTNVDSSLMIGAYLAGISLLGSGGGPTGALSYILGTRFNVPHGIAGGVFLPHIIKFNETRNTCLYTSLGYDIPFTDVVQKICTQLEIPEKLTTFGVAVSTIDILLNECESLKPSFDQNPILFTAEDAKMIIRSMI